MYLVGGGLPVEQACVEGPGRVDGVLARELRMAGLVGIVPEPWQRDFPAGLPRRLRVLGIHSRASPRRHWAGPARSYGHRRRHPISRPPGPTHTRIHSLTALRGGTHRQPPEHSQTYTAGPLQTTHGANAPLLISTAAQQWCSNTTQCVLLHSTKPKLT